MDFPSLHAISPIDGRYRKITDALADHYSEASIIRYRIAVEIEYFIALSQIPLPQLSALTDSDLAALKNLQREFGTTDAEEVKKIEQETNHDVKAVEIWLRRAFDKMGLGAFKEFIHFGLTSQDINNTAFPMAVKEAHYKILLPELESIISTLRKLSFNWKEIPLLARTHGQAASPSFVGKEIFVFVERLETQVRYFSKIPFCGKFGGATGNLNAHYVAYPGIDWSEFANRFLFDKLGLQRQQTTTQIEHYDQLAAYFDNCKRINTILLDLCRDFWTYISMDYFRQKIIAGEIGSSTMPHKVNPIDFENAEGNLGLANAIFEHLSAKLPISRLQRDLTDSTVIRNFGVPAGHTLIAFKSIMKGLGKIIINEDKIRHDLQENWAVVAEAIQTILRREGYPDPYSALKSLTRVHGGITQAAILEFIDNLDITETVKTELKAITPENYTGKFTLQDNV